MFFGKSLAYGVRGSQKFTWVLMFIVFGLQIFNPIKESLNSDIREIHQSHSKSGMVSKLYLEYCIRRVTDRKHCIFSKPFFKLKIKKNEIEKSKDKNLKGLMSDLGEKYQGTKHYLAFYKKLTIKHKDIQELPSYQEYLESEKFYLDAAKEVHKKHFVLGKRHNHFFMNLISIFQGAGWFSTIWILLSLWVFGRHVEWILGVRFTALCLIGLPFFLLKAKMSILDSESITYFVGGGVLTSILYGIFWAEFFPYSKKFPFFLKGLPRFKLRTSKFMPVLFLTQELFLSWAYVGGIPHKTHIFGFLLGAIATQIWFKYQKVPKGMLNKKFKQKWEFIQTQPEKFQVEETFNLLRDIPYCFEVKIHLLLLILKLRKQSNDPNEFVSDIDRVLELILLEKNNIIFRATSEVLLGLKDLPLHFEFGKYFRKRHKSLLHLILNKNWQGIENIQCIKLVKTYVELGGDLTKIPTDLIKDKLIHHSYTAGEIVYLEHLSVSGDSLGLRDLAIEILRRININQSSMV